MIEIRNIIVQNIGGNYQVREKMKLYSLQILMLAGFLGELILNGATTNWFLFFSLALIFVTILNVIGELVSEISHSKIIKLSKNNTKTKKEVTNGN